VTAKVDDPATQAAKQLEAFFLRRLLAEARPEGGNGIDGGFAGDTFKQMLDEAVADKMSAAGGIGMAAMFAHQLGGKGAAPAAPIQPTGMAVLHPSVPATGPELDGLPQLALPLPSTRVASPYGYRPDAVLHVQNHPGVDLAAKIGTGVSAAARGTVVHAGPAGTYGNLVTVRHDNGFETRYAHLSAVTVQKGQQVTAGQEVGKVGSTGYSTGPHLHFELRRDGKTVDPVPLLPLNNSRGRTNR
jgi:murein DD-endopeptidase MepM/ murein hydrolase activator NlpD